MAALGWLMNLDLAGSGVTAPTDLIARSRMLHFPHHVLLLSLVTGATVWM